MGVTEANPRADTGPRPVIEGCFAGRTLLHRKRFTAFEGSHTLTIEREDNPGDLEWMAARLGWLEVFRNN